ncbi:MAG: Smr/MutS family protein, partial [Vulcanimicrobiaceae bacterium]
QKRWPIILSRLGQAGFTISLARANLDTLLAKSTRYLGLGGGKKRKESGPFEALRALKDKLSAEAEEEKAPPKKAVQVPVKRTAPPQPEDEALLLHRLLSGVKPLDKSRGRVPKERGERSEGDGTSSAPPGRGKNTAERAVERGRETEQAEAAAVQARLHELVEGGERFEVSDDGRRIEGRRVDLPLEALRRLRRGLLPIDARLDLHGMRVQEARGELDLFLRTMRARGERCLLVVHGKGEHSPQGMGVLRGEMGAWLSQGASSQHVAAFVTAREGDGGEGAVYVLLRR